MYENSQISCFMNIKNVLSQGYPFVESIISALPICKEFIISDGYSDDGSYEILKKLGDIYSNIEIIRIKWPAKSANGEILAETANNTKELCNGKYIFYIQANEVIHEKSILKLKSIPSLHPKVNLFHLPVYNILGKQLLFSEEFRLRLTKNNKDIVAIGDAGQLKYNNKHIINSLLNSFFRIKDLKDNLGNIYTAYGFDRGEFLHINLPEPIFRYYSLFKLNYLQKLSIHKKLFADTSARFSEIEKKLKNSKKFEDLVYEHIKKRAIEPAFVYKYEYIYPINQPKIMQPILHSKNKKYKIQESLLKKDFYENIDA